MMAHMHDQRCKDVFAMLSEYLDLELPPDACREIETHMAGCPPCIEFAESLRRTIELCRTYRPEEMPGPISDGAREELMAAYRRMVEARRGGGRGEEA